MWKIGRYQLRSAAGQYWLIDMEQNGSNYIPPVGMNETGAMILESFLKGGNVDACAAKLQEEYGIDFAEAKEDAAAFLDQLRAKGVQI